MHAYLEQNIGERLNAAGKLYDDVDWKMHTSCFCTYVHAQADRQLSELLNVFVYEHRLYVSTQVHKYLSTYVYTYISM